MFSLGLLSVDWFIVWNFQVAALNFGDFYNMQYIKMYNFFMVQLQVQWSIVGSDMGTPTQLEYAYEFI
jgi:hypothetical protein